MDSTAERYIKRQTAQRVINVVIGDMREMVANDGLSEDVADKLRGMARALENARATLIGA